MLEIFEERPCLISCLVGSVNQGLATPESDLDYKFFVLPTVKDLYKGPFFSATGKTSTFDYAVYDIRKLPEMLWKSNPTTLEILFSKKTFYFEEFDYLFKNRELLSQMNLFNFKNSTMGMFYQLDKKLKSRNARGEEFSGKTAAQALKSLTTLIKYMHGESMERSLLYLEDDIHKYILMEYKTGKRTFNDYVELSSDILKIWQNNMAA